MAITISQVAKAAGVSVRTLHHYDEIGLFGPSGRSEAGYRLYEREDLLRLQQILFFKELGFPLEQIGRILRDPAFDLEAALRMQRTLLEEKSARIRALIATVDQTLESLERGTNMTKEEMFEVFGDFDPTRYQDEARERWGGSDAWRESSKRTARYGKKEWQRIRAESDAISRELAEAMTSGAKPTDAEVLALAEKHRKHIERWFYPCPPEMHRGLGELYVNDPRFTENIDKAGKGLAAFMREAFRANAERHA